MAQVTFDPTVGGDGSTVSDTSDPNIGLANGGYRERLVPALGQFIAIAIWLKNKAAEVLGYRNDAEGFATAANAAKNAAEAAAATAGGAAAFVDSNPIVKGSADPTKRVRFEVDGLSAGAMRTITVPDKDISLPDLGGANEFGGMQSAPTFSGGVVVIAAAAGAVTLDLALGDMFDLTVTGNITSVTFTNVPALAANRGIAPVVTYRMGGTAYTISYPAVAKWITSGGTAPAAPAANKVLEVAFTKVGANGFEGRKGATT